MPPFFSLVERVRETDHSIYELILKLKVVHMYEQPPYGRSHAKPTLEMILHDRVGNRIHDTMRKSDLEGFNIDFVESGRHRINCTFWGAKVVSELTENFLDKTNHPLICILQFYRGRVYQGKVQPCNTYHITKIIFNGEIEDIINFRNRLPANSGVNALTVSTCSGSSINNIDDDLLSEVITEENWCYLACTRCSRKVSQVGGRDFCDKCNLKDVTGSYRYKLLLKIDNETDITSLILWNKESVELIGKTAMELQALMVECKERIVLPFELNNLIHQEVLFKVQVWENDTNPKGPFNVIRVSVDNDVISKYCGMRVIHEEHTVPVPHLHTILATADFADEPKHSSERSASTQQSTTMLTDSSSVKKNLNSQFSSMTNGKNTSPVIKIEKE
ncbi:hypothetical protein C2S51_028978 [Perilla frutescens var. frutescens]|nr:hypothetical protein C2S51_028978 [Perilla frutescens var. frutescens]